MKVKWRIHELILVTVAFTGFNLVYLWHHLSPEQGVINRQYAEIFAVHHLVFSEFRNLVLPEAGFVFLCYLAYLAVNLSMVRRLCNAIRTDLKIKVLTLSMVFVSLASIFSAAFVLSLYLNEEWRYHYSGFSIFFAGHSTNDRINLAVIGPVCGVTAVFLFYIILRERIIRYLEKPGTKRNYRIMIVNLVTAFISVYLLVALILQFALKIALFELLTRMNIIPLPAVILGFICIYYFFPANEGKPLFGKGLLFRLLLTSFLLALPLAFLIPGKASLVFLLAWLFLLLVIVPVSWLLYQQQKDPILAVKSLEQDFSRSKADMQFLRSQINPHFLFNTLNTIYASALEENANRTAKCLQLLGDMMRFMLDENHADNIQLTREISYLQSYVELQKLRLPLSERMVIDLQIEVDGPNYRIAPMLLMPLVENAFKHGIRLQEPSHIHISLVVNNGRFRLEVTNSVHNRKIADTERSQSGIGLNNVRERLQLVYPGKHAFVAGPSADQYTAEVNIELQTNH
jgi:sensor histidine kinase YesM